MVLQRGFSDMSFITYAPGTSELSATELEPLNTCTHVDVCVRAHTHTHTQQGSSRLQYKTKQQMEQVMFKT
jgi:hypothetical protein